MKKWDYMHPTTIYFFVRHSYFINRLSLMSVCKFWLVTVDIAISLITTSGQSISLSIELTFVLIAFLSHSIVSIDHFL